MARLTRVLVVFVTAASLGFAAFAIALVNGGPNWQTLAAAPELASDVAINLPETPAGSYSAVHRSSGDKIKDSKVLAEVVIEGQKRVLDDLKKEEQELSELLTKLKPQLDDHKKLVEADQAGILARAEAWSQQLARLKQALDQLNQQLQTRTVEATQIQKDLEERRFEVLRLQNQLELLRDDLAAAEQQRDALVNELDQLRESQQRLDRRQKQLQQQTGEKYEPGT